MNHSQQTRPIFVLKVGGNEIDDDTFLAGFVEAVAALQDSARLVIVHGGGKEIAQLHHQLNVPFDIVEGLRVTSADSLRLVKMVLSGVVNTRLTRWLVNQGVDALGLSGVDLGLIRVRPLRPRGQDIGYVGQVVEVRTDHLLALLASGYVPVVSPISLGVDGHSYNVNADQVAGALAVAMNVQRLVFVSNVPGVLLDGQTQEPVSRLTISETLAYMETGQIKGGMVPKVRSALEAVGDGVAEALITDLRGLSSGVGTALVED